MYALVDTDKNIVHTSSKPFDKSADQWYDHEGQIWYTDNEYTQYSWQKLIGPIQFKLLFTAQERITLRMLRAKINDPDPNVSMLAYAIDDWFQILDDPRTQLVDLTNADVLSGIDLLVPFVLTTERAEKIKEGYFTAYNGV